MQGYVTFILALAVLGVLLHVFSLQGESSLNEAIAVEQLYQTEQNMKFLVLEGARQGAKEGLLTYTATHPTRFNAREAESFMERAAYTRLQQLPDRFSHIRARLHCGPQPLAYFSCSDCLLLVQCPEIVHAQVEKLPDKIIGRISLGSASLPFPQVILIHMERTDFPVKSLGYIPITEEQVIEVAGTN